ncbi:MAG: helix-turn-helix domain-containing protein [Actinomycetota bacterium]|nr:helix-turn-helix domain-containing protein [Actinomycetota bacterium]
MPRRQHHVTLTATQRTALRDRLRRGAVPAMTQTRARILLLADRSQGSPRRTDAQIAEVVGCSVRSVARARAAFTDHGLGCLDRRPSANPPTPKLASADEARLVAIACGPPPAGQARWTLRLLAGRAVELSIVDALSYETVRRTLKKTSASRG